MKTYYIFECSVQYRTVPPFEELYVFTYVFCGHIYMYEERKKERKVLWFRLVSVGLGQELDVDVDVDVDVDGWKRPLPLCFFFKKKERKKWEKDRKRRQERGITVQYMYCTHG